MSDAKRIAALEAGQKQTNELLLQLVQSMTAPSVPVSNETDTEVNQTPVLSQFETDKDFTAKFQRQYPKAVNLAKNKGAPAYLVAAPKDDGIWSVWYRGDKRMPKGGVRLLTIRASLSVARCRSELARE